jgi:hypothetical protein
MSNAAQLAVYLLCLLTSATCAGLLLRNYINLKTRFLLFSTICFALLTLNNFLVLLDIMLLSAMDLLPYRHMAALAGICVLLIGFILDVE